MIEIRKSTFDEIAPYWRNFLWDARYDFQPVSCMLYLKGYDASIVEKYRPEFFVAAINGITAGVVSAHATSAEHFRLRGLCVLPNFQENGVGRALVQATIDEARRQHYKMLWAAPRKSAWEYYEKLGFQRASEFTNEGFLYGPNCYAVLTVLNPVSDYS